MSNPSLAPFASVELAVGASSAVVLVIGVVVAALLVGAVWLGIRRRRREPAPPRAEDQPRRPGRGRHTEGAREPDGAGFPADGSRRTAHEMKGYGNLGSKPEGGNASDEP
ncbi:DUF6479 family protein [Streptomyces sp. NPDC051555]|uniref:DUF6479 family protein n=1 Tax=Streptomyces sp. NPDC051555 TaxID=3365657 RepID=UPI0037B1ACFB